MKKEAIGYRFSVNQLDLDSEQIPHSFRTRI